MLEVNSNMFETIVVPDAFAETIASNLKETIIAVVLNNTANARILTQKELEVLMELAENFSCAEELCFKVKGVTNVAKYNFSSKNKTEMIIKLFIDLTRIGVWCEHLINENNKIGFSWHNCETGLNYELYYLVKTEEEQ